MVYCTKCGTENADDASVCTNCGASLSSTVYRSRRRDWDDDICFGGPRNIMWPLIIGVFIILIGLSSIFEEVFWWASWSNLWAIFLIVVGLMIVYNGLQRRR